MIKGTVIEGQRAFGEWFRIDHDTGITRFWEQSGSRNGGDWKVEFDPNDNLKQSLPSLRTFGTLLADHTALKGDQRLGKTNVDNKNEVTNSIYCDNCKGFGKFYRSTALFYGDGTIITESVASKAESQRGCNKCFGSGLKHMPETMVSYFDNPEGVRQVDNSDISQPSVEINMHGTSIELIDQPTGISRLEDAEMNLDLRDLDENADLVAQLQEEKEY